MREYDHAGDIVVDLGRREHSHHDFDQSSILQAASQVDSAVDPVLMATNIGNVDVLTGHSITINLLMVREDDDDPLVMLCPRIQEINGVAQALTRIFSYQKCSGRRTLVFPSVDLPRPPERATDYRMGKVEAALEVKHTGKTSVGAV